MSAAGAPSDPTDAGNGTASTAPPSVTTPAPPTRSPQPPLLPTNAGSPAGFSHFSAATAEILNRIRAGNSGHAAGTPTFEAKRAEVMQNYMTSDKISTPPPSTAPAKRGRGGRVGTPSSLKMEVGASSATGSPATPARGSGRGRGRGKGGRGGGRGGKRKRSESFGDSEDDSDISTSYTPLPTKTKSGRNVNKPVAFVPTLPEPTSSSVKRRRSTKMILAAQCKTCHRGTDPSNNRIVFCDACNTPYHQYCHNPPIANEFVTVLEKEWLCAPCARSKLHVVEGTDGLVSGEGLSVDQKRAYLSTLPQTRLVSLLLHATIRHPELPLYPPNVESLIPDAPQPTTMSVTSTTVPTQPNPTPSISLSNGPASNDHIPRPPSTSELNSAPAQPTEPTPKSPLNPAPSTTPSNPQTEPAPPINDDEDEAYDSDPPAHYPKPGNGLARTMRPESEDLQWLVDDNFEVFSHSWKGDGDAQGILAGAGEGVGNGDLGGLGMEMDDAGGLGGAPDR